MTFFKALVFLGLIASVSLADFKQVNSINYQELRSFFPNASIKAVSKLDLSLVDPELRPSLWPKAIPFFVGISHTNQHIFYYHYEFIGFSKIKRIPGLTGPFSDVESSSLGDIFIASDTHIHVYRYAFDSKRITHILSYPISAVKALSLSGTRNLLLLLDNAVVFLSFRRDQFFQKKALSKKISKAVADDTLLHASYTDDGHICIVSATHLYFFNRYGSLLSKQANTGSHSIVDSTAESDYILLSPANNQLDKYSKHGQHVFSKRLSSFNSPILDLAIYKPYANMAVFDSKKGLYFTMKTNVSGMTASSNSHNRQLQVNSSFDLHFPSSVSISILSKQAKTAHILEENKRLSAGTHHFQWPNIPSEYAQGYIKFLAKGLYSESNTVEKVIQLEKNH